MFTMSLSSTLILVMTYLVVQGIAVSITVPANITISSNGKNNDIGDQCTKARTWVANGFHRQDCTSIIDYIYDTEVLKHAMHRFVFISPSTPDTEEGIPKIMTPRKYVHGTCVITVAMLDQFRPQELPGSDFRERYEERDVATFFGVWDAALKVDFGCGRFGQAGWVAMGKLYFKLMRGVIRWRGAEGGHRDLF